MQPGQDPLAIVTGAHPSIAGGPTSMASSSSLAARRAAASGLPSSFELPPPPSLTTFQNKYQPQINVNTSTNHPGHGPGNLLTPPNTVPSEGISPPSSGGSSQAVSSAAAYQQQSAPSYNPGLWSQSPPPGANQFAGFPTGTTPQHWIPPRGLYSPLNSMVRASADGLPGQAYEMNQLPPFGNGMQMPSPSTLPQMSAAQQVQAQQQAMMMSAQQNPFSHGGMLPQHPTAAHDSYAVRPPPTPTYFHQNSSQNHQGQGTPNSATPQPPNLQYPSNMHHSQVSPHSADAQSARMSPLQGGNDGHMSAGSLPSSTQSPSHQFSPHQRAYSHPFSLPAMPGTNGPVMSNMHTPNGQMALVGGHGGMGQGMMPGGFNSGHAAASMQNMYGAPMSPHQQQSRSPPQHGHNGSHGGTPQTPNDRPFKCDQCVQSFNRNHDLKRHKRIHLAVKPYPCGHCDKSFSRKDALKRHILVKGCGKMGSAAAAERSSSGGSDGSISPMSNGGQMAHMTGNPPAHVNGMMKVEA